jgi:hypothetical protein
MYVQNTAKTPAAHTRSNLVFTNILKLGVRCAALGVLVDGSARPMAVGADPSTTAR